MGEHSPRYAFEILPKISAVKSLLAGFCPIGLAHWNVSASSTSFFTDFKTLHSETSVQQAIGRFATEIRSARYYFEASHPYAPSTHTDAILPFTAYGRENWKNSLCRREAQHSESCCCSSRRRPGSNGKLHFQVCGQLWWS